MAVYTERHIQVARGHAITHLNLRPFALSGMRMVERVAALSATMWVSSRLFQCTCLLEILYLLLDHMDDDVTTLSFSIRAMYCSACPTLLLMMLPRDCFQQGRGLATWITSWTQDFISVDY